MFQCLQENIAKTGFEDPCKAEIAKREERIQDDYRLDYGIASQCAADVDQLCSIEKVRCHNLYGVHLSCGKMYHFKFTVSSRRSLCPKRSRPTLHDDMCSKHTLDSVRASSLK